MVNSRVDLDAYCNEVTRVRKENDKRIQEKLQECKSWIKSNMIDAVVVYTKCKDDISQNRIMVFVNNGSSIGHKLLQFDEMGITKIEMLDTPDRNNFKIA